MAVTASATVDGRPIRTEKVFLSAVVHLAQSFGWLVSHPWLSIHSPSGLPDLVMVRPPRIIFAELKTRKGKLSHAQALWLFQLKQCPQVESYLWIDQGDLRPIAEVLKP